MRALLWCLTCRGPSLHTFAAYVTVDERRQSDIRARGWRHMWKCDCGATRQWGISESRPREDLR